MLPKINSIRTKKLNINGKSIEITPWNNLQLVNYESLLEDETKLDAIEQVLLSENVKCKAQLTLEEQRFILIELYKLSKGNLLDIIFRCEHCENDSKYTINLEKIVQFKEISSRVIDTTNFKFNLRKNSSYRLNLSNELNEESLKYFISFIDSFIYKNTTYDITDIDETFNWFKDEMDNKDFEEFLIKMDKVKPYIEINAIGNCEHCFEKTNLNFKIEDFLV